MVEYEFIVEILWWDFYVSKYTVYSSNIFFQSQVQRAEKTFVVWTTTHAYVEKCLTVDRCGDVSRC